MSRVVIIIGIILGSFILFYATLCPYVFWYDSAEYVAAAVTCGITHPPGYPLYTLIGHLIVQLPFEPAYEMNLLSAIFSSLGTGLLFLICRSLGAGQLGSAVGALTLASSQMFWSQSIIAETYTPGLAFLLAAILFILHGLKREDARFLLGASWLAGIGLGVHMSTATCGLGLALLVLSFSTPTGNISTLRDFFSLAAPARRIRLGALCLGTAVLGSTIFIFIPLRSELISRTDLLNPSTWDSFWWFVTGGNFKNWFATDYDLGRRLVEVAGFYNEQLTSAGLLIAVTGLLYLLKEKAIHGLALLLMISGNTYYFFNYWVHDIAVFFLPGIAIFCCLIGVGAHALVEAIDRQTTGTKLKWAGPVIPLLLLLLPALLVSRNYRETDMSSYADAQNYGEELCSNLPRNAVIVNFTTPTEWKYDAVFSMYFQRVLGRRRDVEVRFNMPPEDILNLQRRGVSVYTYHRDPRITKLFEIRKEGSIWLIGEPKVATGGSD